MASVVEAAVKNVKAYEKVVVPAFPSPNMVSAWLGAIGESLAQTGGFHDDGELKWIFGARDLSFEDLADSRAGTGAATGDRWARADAAIAQGISVLIGKSSGVLKGAVERKKQALLAEYKTVKGRQLIHMCLDHLRTNKSMDFLYTFEDLVVIRWLGDEKLGEFLNAYKSTIAQLKFAIPEETLQHNLVDKMRMSKNPTITLELSWWERKELNDPDRNHAALLGSMELAISKKLELSNRASAKKRIDEAFADGRKASEAAPAPNGGAKAKAKSKAKAKGDKPTSKGGGKGGAKGDARTKSRDGRNTGDGAGGVL